jgi:AraC-like DNA-binding protein
MHYGAGVDIDPGALKDFFLLQLPVRGHETIVAGGQTVHSTPAMASIVSPSLSFHMRHGAGTEKLFMRIDRLAMERQFRQLHGRPARGAIEFAPGIDLGSRAGHALQRMTGWMFAEASDGGLLDQPLIGARVEEVLMTTLLEALAHNQAVLVSDGVTVSPRFIRRAQEYISDHCHEPLTVGAIAANAGVSTRSLFDGFRKYRDTTPMAFLRDLRLDKVHAELQQASGPGAVTTTAMRWGFMHLGQFSAAYQRRFGLLPSQTRAPVDAPQRQ